MTRIAASLLMASLLLAPGLVQAQPAQSLTMERIMADPDWIGPPVEQAWWSWDGRSAYFTTRRADSTIRDIQAIAVDGSGAARVLDGAGRADIDGAQPVVDGAGARMAFVRNGDIFVRDLRNGALTQLTRSDAGESAPQWADDGALIWRSGHDWFRWTAQQGVTQAAVVKAEDDPAQAPKADALRDYQFELIDTLRGERDRRDAQREQDRSWRRDDPTRAPEPAYLGKDVGIANTALSPDGRWLLVATEPKSGDRGQGGKMPKYVTESGYEETEDVRTRVGRNEPLAQTFWLVDMRDGARRELALGALPGIGTDPLADLRKAAGRDPLKGPRAVRLESRGAGAVAWSGDSRRVALMLHSVDNKDRWLVSLDPADPVLRVRHRLTDPAWINWSFNEFGWLPDNRSLWFLSEESGWSHLYVAGEGARPRALTSGRWEVSEPVLSADGRHFFFLCNREWPGRQEVCTTRAGGGGVAEVTRSGGIEGFALSPRGGQLLLRKSTAYVPAQLAVASIDDGDIRTLTDTRTAEFRAFDWLDPEIVQVPSSHGAGTIWGKYYGPQTLEPGRQYPIVLFVHGAGYLQNVHDRYPQYFREQMFHNLLVQRGYIVLDLDFRASAGLGRDWRTAIYRQMGHPELEDYLDGIDWLVARKQGDRERVGIYGGSYGGFMTFMALFREPGKFKAGAALRPVADWTQYNHDYTSNILNTPQLDPDAHRRSSPMTYADGLQDHLLIAHGMIDDNVFYKDSVMLAQRLIELRKDKWELASYPMERHAYQHADSWYDQYRRILELFERTLK